MIRALRYVGQGDATGYGLAAIAMVRGLRDSGVDVVWEPMLLGQGLNLGYEPDASGCGGPADLWSLRADNAQCACTVLHTVPEYYPYFLARERARQGGTARIWGSSVWETDRIPAHWPDLINQLDGLIVPSEWNRQIFRDSGVTTPIAVIPHLPQCMDVPVTPEASTRLISRLAGLRPDTLVFYVISTWLERKGIAPLIQAFTQAFTARDNVALVVKTTSEDLERKARNFWPPRRLRPAPVAPQFARMTGRRRQIRLLVGELPEAELRALHARGDCYASLCRAEGWGLGAYEAAFLGKPVIMTGWGGQMAFLRPETAYLVDWRIVPVRPAVPDQSYTPAQNWAEPDIASAVAALRTVAGDLEAARRRGAALRQDVRTRFTRASIVSNFMSALG